jgi:hypothetical protein
MPMEEGAFRPEIASPDKFIDVMLQKKPPRRLLVKIESEIVNVGNFHGC